MDNNEQYQPYQQYAPQTPHHPMMQPHRATLVLIFGIVGLVSCGIFGLLAWLFGNEDLKKMDVGMMDPSGREMTNTGRILGIVSVCLNALGILAGIVYAVFVMGIMGAAASSAF